MKIRFALALLMMLGATSLRAQDIGLEVGAKPKPVTLNDLDGRAYNLAQVMGKKPVLLEFWATWCPLCKALEPQLAAARKKYPNVDFVVVAVGVNQNPRSIKRHLASHPLPGRVLWDGDGAAVRAFEAPGTSYVVMLDKSGKVVYTGAGSDQKLEPAIRLALR